jgi:hypothetical protein
MCSATRDVHYGPIADIDSYNLLAGNGGPAPSPLIGFSWLQGLQERRQIFHLGVGETEFETQIVEIHHIQQRGG